MLSAYSAAYGIKFACLRYFNAAGATPAGGEYDCATHLLPIISHNSLNGIAVSVFGSNYATPDGYCVRDYVHVADITDAHLKALNYLRNGGDSTSFNIGTGKGSSVKQVIEEFERQLGRPIKVKCAPRRDGDPAFLTADASKIKQALKWKPKHGLKEIVSTELEWRKKLEGK